MERTLRRLVRRKVWDVCLSHLLAAHLAKPSAAMEVLWSSEDSAGNQWGGGG